MALNGILSEIIGNGSGGNRFNFPVFFPVTGNLAEKGSLTTGSSAKHSCAESRVVKPMLIV